ncbi:MAG: TlpA family protein disulfide reductase [Planctomycetes bacterium]|nr:TlpA family protein disulfide reductase [Planctomycetota bacterium]
MSRKLFTALLVLALSYNAALARPLAVAPESTDSPAVARLSVGDAAPELSIEVWLKGARVEKFKAGEVYLIDFWATWCGPCIRSMPHLNELQAQYKDKGFTVIGLSSTDKRGNTLRAVESLLQTQPDLMSYTVAWDKARVTTDAYMAAAGKSSIPTAFLIDRQGKIAFIGHPSEVDSVLEQVIAGTHDLASLSAKYKVRTAIEEQARVLQAEYVKAFRKKDWATVLELADKLLALDPFEFGVMAAIKFRINVRELDDCAKGYAFARAHFAGLGKNDWMAMSAVAFEIIDPGSKIKTRDLDYALQLCSRANELSGGVEAPVLDAIARIYYLKGDLVQAVAWQTKAAAVDANLETTLEQYKDELAKKS